jgi:hypothetical protein
MIYLNINLRHPAWAERFKNIWHRHGVTFVPDKHWEVQVIKNDNLLRFEFGWTVRQDHAGINLELGLLGYETHFTIYDHRHWDYENKCWAKYNQSDSVDML